MNEDVKLNRPLKEIPVLYISFIAKETTKSIDIQSDQYLWEYNNENDTDARIIGDSFFHPLAMADLLLKVELPEGVNKVSIQFSENPTSYTVRYWPDYYAGNQEAQFNYKNYLKTVRDAIALPKDKGIIVQVYALWPQGEAYYAFYMIRV
ncbi:MAG: hypothetical protein K0S76_2684 [Herbinix sp.]|jgi:hypothetical protein|nr:hypothetical protein [Herbinix sp.]